MRALGRGLASRPWLRDSLDACTSRRRVEPSFFPQTAGNIAAEGPRTTRALQVSPGSVISLSVQLRCFGERNFADDGGGGQARRSREQSAEQGARWNETPDRGPPRG